MIRDRQKENHLNAWNDNNNINTSDYDNNNNPYNRGTSNQRV